MQTASARLPVRKPFSLFSTAVSHGWYQTLPFRWARSDDALERAERLQDGRVLLLRMREERSQRRGHRDVVLTVRGEGVRDLGVMEEMQRRCRVMLRLDERLDGFYAVCKTILGTNVTWRQAVSMINRLAQLGDVCAADSSLRAWPTPGQVLRAGEKFQRETVRAGYRSPYILELARRQKSGDIDLDTLDARATAMSADELFKTLTALKGI